MLKCFHIISSQAKKMKCNIHENFVKDPQSIRGSLDLQGRLFEASQNLVDQAHIFISMPHCFAMKNLSEDV